MDRPGFLWREVTDDELAADLAALRAGRYPRLRLAGDSTWTSTHFQTSGLTLERFWSIWLEDDAGNTAAIVLQRLPDRALWRRSDLHE